MHRPFLARASTAALATLALGACGGGAAKTSPSTSTASGSGAAIKLQNIAYTPTAVTIAAGQSVTWQWADAPTIHDVNFDSFQSKLQSSGTYTHVFAQAGTYHFHCSVHPAMTGTVTVTP